VTIALWVLAVVLIVVGSLVMVTPAPRDSRLWASRRRLIDDFAHLR
jgi:cytochrome c-type biogenesis protein CcmH/NrfF